MIRPLLLAILIAPFVSMGQGVFETGYFVDNQGKKTECLIKVDWSHNPSPEEFVYKTNQEVQPITLKIADVMEFGSKNNFKFIRAKVAMDLSGEDGTLSNQREPDWYTDQLFLRVLVEGSMNLYVFNDEHNKKFFFGSDVMPIEQLVYKKYSSDDGPQVNDSFRTALSEKVNCGNLSKSYFRTVKYDEVSLTNHFVDFSKCNHVESLVYKQTNAASNSITASDANANKKEKLTYHYLGVEANQLIRQLFNLSNNNNPVTNLYLIQYAINSRKTGKGFSVGLNYNTNTFTDNSNNVSRKTDGRTIAFRIGYDYKYELSRKWITGFGFDLLLDGTKSHTENSQNNIPFAIDNKSNGSGFGPRMFLMFRIHEKIFLATEAAYYWKTTNSNVTGTGLTPSTQTSTSFGFTIPVALFLTVRLNN
ncbi:MAG: hypothetical protein HYR67_08205 [Bacteroidetes bacterium]|nr:hypothetical protein [Bacteroidota bacterium]